MSASSLLTSTQKAYTQSDALGIAEEIVYNHRDGTIENVRAFVDITEEREDKTKERYDKVLFHNVELTISPKMRDYINYQGEELIVQSWRRQLGVFEITTVSNKSLKNRRK